MGLLLMIFLFGSAVQVSAADIRAVQAFYLTVRADASNDAKEIGTLEKGMKVTCIGKKGNWIKIKFEGKKGYVYKTYLKKVKAKKATSTKKTITVKVSIPANVSEKAAKAATTTVTAETTTSTYKRYVKADFLSVRKKASGTAEVIGEFVLGDKVTCYGKEGNWTIVKYNGKKAYVYSSYLVKKKPQNVATSQDNQIALAAASDEEALATVKKVNQGKTYTMYVDCTDLNVREKADGKSKIIATYYTGEKMNCLGIKGDWTKVVCAEGEGYMYTSYLSKEKVAKDAYVSGGKGKDVAAFAKKYLGLKYIWGGASLTKGADCSGFTQQVYKRFGYSLPHSSKAQRNSGFAVAQADRKPGDLICYNSKLGVGHVGIYIGNNQVIHASGEKTGVKISTWNYRKVNCVRRLIK